MSLRLIYGRAGSGKTYFCLNEIKEKLNADGDTPLVLIVPEQFTLQAEKSLVKTAGIGGIIRTEVLSFRRMAYRVFNEVGGLTRKHLNASGKCMLIYRVIDGMKQDLKVFSKAVKQQGFINTIAETIAEMKRYNITPRHLDIVSAELNNEALKDKLMELASIYDEFEKNLHEKYMDSDDDLTELAEKLSQSKQFNGAEIWVDGFTGFTPQEFKVIENLLKKSVRVNICLCTDCLTEEGFVSDTDVFFPAKNTVRKLLKLAKENNITVELPVWMRDTKRFGSSKELVHLEQEFFSFPYRKYKENTRDICIFSAVNIYTEVEKTARGIIELCRDGGMRYRDIAVVTRNLDGYEKLVSVIFEEYGIPCFIDRKRDINSHPLVLLVLSALEIFTENWSYEAVFRYLKTGFTNIDRESIDIIENYVLACGIKGNRWVQDENWIYRMTLAFNSNEMTEYEQDMLRKINEIRLKIIKPLMNFRSKTRGKKQAKEICAALFELLCDMDVPQRIEMQVDEFKQSGELDLANEYGQVWNIIMEVFDQIVEVIGEQSTGIERFHRILAIGFGEYQIGIIPPALDQVLVGSIERSKSHEIRALFIMGVNDGIFPAATIEEGILSDSDRMLLKKSGIELAQDTRTKAFEEQYFIYTALSTSGRYLHLSYPIADHEGRTLRPSRIISRLKKIFPSISEKSNIANVDTGGYGLEVVCAPVPTFNHLLCAVRKGWEGSEVNPLWSNVYNWYMINEKWKLKCNNVMSGLNYSNQVGHIKSENVRKLYGNNIYTSVSRLESFSSCPFSYFIKFGLNAKERKIFQLSAPDVGTFMHEVIDRFSKSLSDSDMNWRKMDREWCEREVSVIVDNLLESMSTSVFNSSQRYRYLSQKLKRTLCRAIWLIAEHIRRSGFEPLGYELAFGEGGKFSPIVIELPSGEKINLTGRIDRIDTMKTEKGTYLRVIDYKSGSKAFKLAEAYYGLQIQLITYLDAIMGMQQGDGSSVAYPGNNETEEPSLCSNSCFLPGGILYFRIDDPIVKGGREISEEEVEKSIMRQLKMKGLLLADVKLIKEMDREIDGDSLIIPARLNKGDVLGRSSAATAGQFELLRRYVRKLLSQIGEEMLNGNVQIRPYKNKRLISCTYCSYSSVCQFDPQLKDNKFRVINDIKDDEVWELIKNEE